jgi:hypothetical protein
MLRLLETPAMDTSGRGPDVIAACDSVFLLRAFGPAFCEEPPQTCGAAAILHEPGTIVNAIKSASYDPMGPFTRHLVPRRGSALPQPLRRRSKTMLEGMKKWLAWLIVGGPVVVYAIGKLLSH